MSKKTSFAKTRPWRIAAPPVSLALLLAGTSCTSFKKTLAMEHRVFIRVPGGLPPAGKTLESGGWHFRHVLQGPAAKTPEAQWYLAWHDEGRGKLTQSGILPPWGRARELAPELAAATFEVFHAYPQLIEPGLVFKEGAGDKGVFPKPEPGRAGDIPEVGVGAMPSKVWPDGSRDESGLLDPAWHLDDRHSQLASARDAARDRRRPGDPRIRIGILDTGFDSRHVGLPAHLVDEVEGDIIQVLRPENDACDHGCRTRLTSPGQTLDSGHGTGTLGILAGRKIKLVDRRPGGPRVREQEVELGAAPDAEIVAVRVAPWVASLSTANLAHAIDYASRVKGCDVLSISHGGSPSMMWADAVNAAYDRGTAMFAATGDYFPLPLPGRVNRTGVIIPSSAVYPAAYRRVMGVAGVTETGRSYGLTDWPRMLLHGWRPDQIAGSLMRGSYGADGVRRSYFDGSLGKERSKTDIVQIRRYNELRANPIAAYSPGIPWLKAGKDLRSGASTTVDLDGGGTSAATPQAAAAAAHWLAYHRAEIVAAGGWNDWRKAEATYLAMALTANRPWAGDGKPEDQPPDPYLGAGILKARNMLDVSFREALAICGDMLRAPYDGYTRKGAGKQSPVTKKNGAPRDFFDASRSLHNAVIDPDRSGYTADQIAQRADFRHDAEHVFTRRDQHREAMVTLYFNMLLVEQFVKGHGPIATDHEKAPRKGKLFSGPNEAELQVEAERLADGKPAAPRKKRTKLSSPHR